MNQDNRPLYTLTVSDFLELTARISENRSHAHETTFPQIEEKDDKPDIIYLKEAALITGYTEKTVYTKVSRREMPVLSTGRPLTFSRIQLNDWMEKGRPTIAEMMAEGIVKYKNGSAC
ncbi:MAG: helix-turn-helix domain-containing protein [Flavobacteriales bacterium]|nr:helix-turn-helix domain-containing protein [Flavobacteriales bacterium]